MKTCILVDDAISMRRPLDGQLTHLDVAKCGAELLGSALGRMGPSNGELFQRRLHYCLRVCSFFHLLGGILSLLVPGTDKSSILSSFGDPFDVFEDRLKNVSFRDDEDISDITFPISYAIAIANRYRIQSGIDRFGQGRYPCLLEPLNIVIFTDGKMLKTCTNANNSLVQTFRGSYTSTGGDLNENPLRWDHRIFVVVVKPNTEDNIPENLVSLVQSSGGDIISCSNYHDINSNVRNLVPKLTAATVGVTFYSCVTNADDVAIKAPLNLRLHFKGTTIGEWPIPETIFIDANSKSLPTRATYPKLIISASHPPTSDGKVENVNSNSYQDTMCTLYSIAKDLDLVNDTYDIITSNSSSISKSLNIVHGLKYAVSLDLGNDSRSQNTPFGMLISNRGLYKSSYELLVLPWNFPKFLPLLKQGIQIQHDKKVNSIDPASALATWLPNFDKYIQSLPVYYYGLYSKLLKRLGLRSLFLRQSVRPGGPQTLIPGISTALVLILNDGVTATTVEGTITNKLNVAILKKLQTITSYATRDIGLLEAAARECWPDYIHRSIHNSIINTTKCLEYDSYNRDVHIIPESLFSIDSGNLLSMWEKYRSNVYGKGPGYTVRGISVPLIEGRLSYRSSNSSNSSDSSNSDWFNRGAGGAKCVANTMREAGKYLDVLARKEALRDPAMLDPAPDEDEKTGRARRKYVVDFGSKYKKKGGAAATSDSNIIDLVDTMKEAQEIFADTPIPSPKATPEYTGYTTDDNENTSPKYTLVLPSSKRKQSPNSSLSDSNAQKRQKGESGDSLPPAPPTGKVAPIPAPPAPINPITESPASVTSNIVAPGIEAYESKKYRGKLYIIDEKTKNPLWVTVTTGVNSEEAVYSYVDNKGAVRPLNIVKVNYVDKE